MNAFVRHHEQDVAFSYSCFDRVVCNAYIQHLQWCGSVVNFFRARGRAAALTPAFFSAISGNYHAWLEEEARQAGMPIVTPPQGVRRDEWVRPYFQQLGQQTGVAVILKCREPARVVVSYPKQSYHLEFVRRHVNLYYFYLRDAHLGRLFVRLCPYFPFNAQVCFNGHEWLDCQLRREGIAFRRADNAFVACAAPERLQELADQFGPEQVRAAVEPWLARCLPFFSEPERAAGYRHRLYVAQVEYCNNLIFHRQAALDRVFGRLLDYNRAIGTPAKLAVIFGRANFHPDTRTAQTLVKRTSLKTSVLRTGYQTTALKQYVKSRTLLRTETNSHQLKDLSLPKDIKNLPRIRAVLSASNERYLNVQQDVLTSFIDRGQWERLRQPTVSAQGRRTPGLRLDDPRLMAVLQALTCFVYLIGKASFRTSDLLDDVRRALDNPDYKLSQLRYDLAKLRGKGLVMRLPGTQRYQLSPEGYALAVLYQKLHDKIYAPLTAGVLSPVSADNQLLNSRTHKLDRCYQAVDTALHKLTKEAGVAA